MGPRAVLHGRTYQHRRLIDLFCEPNSGGECHTQTTDICTLICQSYVPRRQVFSDKPISFASRSFVATGRRCHCSQSHLMTDLFYFASLRHHGVEDSSDVFTLFVQALFASPWPFYLHFSLRCTTSMYLLCLLSFFCVKRCSQRMAFIRFRHFLVTTSSIHLTLKHFICPPPQPQPQTPPLPPPHLLFRSFWLEI